MGSKVIRQCRFDQRVGDAPDSAVARQLDRTPPWSQQDIVAEALKLWLDKHASIRLPRNYFLRLGQIGVT